MEVELKEIIKLSGYFAGSDGEIYSSKPKCRNGKADGLRKLSRRNDKDGYQRVNITHGGRTTVGLNHRLICEAFHGPRQDKQLVRHLDGNKQNNQPGNLKWGTAKENSADSILHGTFVSHRGSLNGTSVLCEELVLDVKRALKVGVSRSDICYAFSMNQNQVGRIARGELWGWLTL